MIMGTAFLGYRRTGAREAGVITRLQSGARGRRSIRSIRREEEEDDGKWRQELEAFAMAAKRVVSGARERESSPIAALQASSRPRPRRGGVEGVRGLRA
jgi:hypothetical protein